MSLIQRFLLGNRVDDDLQVGLFLKNDGTVWLRNPDGSETQVSGGGGGGFPPAGWTVDADGAFTLSPSHESDIVALRIQKNADGDGDFVEMVITDDADVDWFKIYNHSGWSNDDGGLGVFAWGRPASSGQIANWFGVTQGGFGVAAPADGPPSGASSVDEAAMAWGVQAGGSEFFFPIDSPPDDDVLTSQRIHFYDDTEGDPTLRFKERDSAGNLHTGRSAGLVDDATAFSGIAKPLLAATPTVAQISTVLAGLGLTRQT